MLESMQRQNATKEKLTKFILTDDYLVNGNNKQIKHHNMKIILMTSTARVVCNRTFYSNTGNRQKK